MIGETLTETRDRIDSLASDGGEYYLVCARCGDRPVPASDSRFETRAIARAATRATERYRRALRRYDPRVPYYDVIACQDVERESETGPTVACCESDRDTGEWSLSEPVVNRSTTVDRALVEFCHRVAAAVFETLSTHGFDTVESAIMDAYFAHAEELSEPDGLCIRLLESMAIELADRLDPSEQVTLLSAAAGRLEYAFGDTATPSVRRSGGWAVDESLSVLRDIGLFERGRSMTDSMTVGDQSTLLVVGVSGYTLRPHDGRLPLLPIALAVHRCEGAWIPTRADASDDGWRVSFRSIADSEPTANTDDVFAPEMH